MQDQKCLCPCCGARLDRKPSWEETDCPCGGFPEWHNEGVARIDIVLEEEKGLEEEKDGRPDAG